MYLIFLTICSMIVAWGLVEFSWLIFVNIFMAIDNFMQDRAVNNLKREFLDNPVEFIDSNDNVKWIYKK